MGRSNAFRRSTGTSASLNVRTKAATPAGRLAIHGGGGPSRGGGGSTPSRICARRKAGNCWSGGSSSIGRKTSLISRRSCGLKSVAGSSRASVSTRSGYTAVNARAHAPPPECPYRWNLPNPCSSATRVMPSISMSSEKPGGGTVGPPYTSRSLGTASTSSPNASSRRANRSSAGAMMPGRRITGNRSALGPVTTGQPILSRRISRQGVVRGDRGEQGAGPAVLRGGVEQGERRGDVGGLRARLRAARPPAVAGAPGPRRPGEDRGRLPGGLPRPSDGGRPHPCRGRSRGGAVDDGGDERRAVGRSPPDGQAGTVLGGEHLPVP